MKMEIWRKWKDSARLAINVPCVMNTAILRQQARTAVIEGRNAGLGMDEPVTMKDGSVGVTMRFKGRTRSRQERGLS